MRTGRPRKFNLDEALDRAMDVFWRQGYEGASLADLTAAMGINSPSLYAAFENKEGLFRAVLDRYDSVRKGFMDEVLSAPSARDVAEAFLKGVVDYTADPKNLPGCLLLQSGLSCSDNVIPNELARHRAQKELALRERFECARRSGDLPKDADAGALARYLVTVSNGMAVQATSGATAADLREIARIALMAWPVGNTTIPRKARRRRKTSERAALAH